MKKLFSLVLMIALMSNSFATITYQTQLNKTFDKFTYELSQVGADKTKTAEIIKGLENELKNLMAEGLTKEDLVAFAKGEVKNDAIAKEIDTILALNSLEALNEKQVMDLVVKSLKDGEATGSNYTGAIMWQAAGILVAVILLVVIFTAEGCDSEVEECPVYEPYYCYDPFYDPYWPPHYGGSWGYYYCY